jgi:hypothetical protein
MLLDRHNHDPTFGENPCSCIWWLLQKRMGFEKKSMGTGTLCFRNPRRMGTGRQLGGFGPVPLRSWSRQNVLYHTPQTGDTTDEKSWTIECDAHWTIASTPLRCMNKRGRCCTQACQRRGGIISDPAGACSTRKRRRRPQPHGIPTLCATVRRALASRKSKLRASRAFAGVSAVALIHSPDFVDYSRLICTRRPIDSGRRNFKEAHFQGPPPSSNFSRAVRQTSCRTSHQTWP